MYPLSQKLERLFPLHGLLHYPYYIKDLLISFKIPISVLIL